MSKFHPKELKVYLQLFITMLSDKQAAGIAAHVDVSDWTKARGKMISLSQQLESGELMLIENVLDKSASPTLAGAIAMTLAKNYNIRDGAINIGEFKPDDQGFDRRKLRDAIVKTVNLSEPTATRIVTLNRGCSVKELVYMALEYRGRQLSSPRDQKHDAQWYANHHIATVLHHVEEIMMEGV